MYLQVWYEIVNNVEKQGLHKWGSYLMYVLRALVTRADEARALLGDLARGGGSALNDKNRK